MEPPYRRHGDGVRVRIKAHPNARRDALQGLEAGPDGQTSIKVALSAPAEGGRANDALNALLARECGVAKSAIRVAMGATQRRKVVDIRGEADEIERLLSAWIAELRTGEQT